MILSTQNPVVNESKTSAGIIRRTGAGLLLCCGLLRGAETYADQPPSAPPDKSVYTFFNPTPSDQLRAFNPNRPSVTEGPFTIDAGHFQVEMSFVEYTYDCEHGVRTDDFSVAPTELRVGILNDLEFDLIVSPYLNQWTHGGGTSNRLSGFGDTTIRATWNAWGNDGGATAFAVIGLVTFPTASDGLSNHHLQGGVILPFAVNLPADFLLEAMAEFDIDRNAANTGYGLNLLQSVNLTHMIFGRLAGYVEYVGIAPIDTGQTYLAYFDTGLTYLLADNVQLDFGINIGLSGHANDLVVVTGLAFRI
jgi:hypothetical protein